jgi:hypothetical protein
MLMGEDLFVSGAKIAHHLVMDRPDMSMQIWPAVAGDIASLLGTIVAKKQHSVIVDFQSLVFDT